MDTRNVQSESSACADRPGIAPAQVKVDEKSNEITEKKSNYLISLKENQSSLHADVKEFFSRNEKSSA